MRYEEVEIIEEKEDCGLPKIRMKDIRQIKCAHRLEFEDGTGAIFKSMDFDGLLNLQELDTDWRIVKIKGCLYLAALKKYC